VKTFSKLLSSKWLRISLSVIISIAALYLALRGVDFSSVWLSIQNAIWAYIFLALGSIAINFLVKALRWKVLVGPPGQNISLIIYLMVLLAGQMLNNLFPARIGDLARAYELGGRGPGRIYVLGTIVLEKTLDSIAYLTLFGILILLIPIPDWIGGSIIVFVLITFTMIAGILLLLYFPKPFTLLQKNILKRLPARWQMWLTPRISRGLESLEIIRRRDDLIRLIFWTVIIWITAVVTNYFVLLSLDIHLPAAAPMLILFGLQAGVSLSAIPATIGLFEYICVLALAVFGIDQATALSFGLLLHAIVLFANISVGTLSFWVLGLSGQRDKFQDAIP
jgi:uncharacterized protein (TIRG00374 family)